MWLDDPYWLKASKFLVNVQEKARYVLAPAEFNGLRNWCLPVSFSYIVEKSDCIVVIPKQDVDFLPLDWIVNCSRWDFIYADEVFVAFSISETRGEVLSGNEHLPYLLDRAAKVIQGEKVRSSRIDEALSDDIGSGKPYVVLAAASLTGNGGDRLIAAAAKRLIRRAWPSIGVVVADGNPDRTLVRDATAVIIGPGGMLYDLESTRIDLMNLANWFRYGHLAAEYGVPLFVMGLGHQGMCTEIGWEFVVRSLATARLVTTRDRETAQELVHRLDCPVEALPDLSVLFAEDIQVLAATLGRRVLTICGDFRYIRFVADCISQALAGAGDVALRFVIQANEDHVGWEVHRDELDSLMRSGVEVVDCRTADPMMFCAAIATSDAVITTRFHGLMVALMAGVDTLALTHRGDKRERLREEIGDVSWVRFHPWTRDLRAVSAMVADMLARARRDPARAVRFDPIRFDRLVDRLSSALS